MVDIPPSSSLLPLTGIEAAHRFPNELVDEIALCFCAQYKNFINSNRTPLRHICFVSRRWAGIARPILWQEVEIASAAHLRKLCDLLDIPPPASLTRVSEMIVWVRCSVNYADCSQPPWLHHVYPQLVRRLKHLQSVTSDPVQNRPYQGFWLNFTHDGTLADFQTIHPRLPRNLPSCFAPVTDLLLVNVRFKDRAALLRLLLTLEHLRILICKELRWESSELPSGSLVLRSQLRSVSLDGASDPCVQDEDGMRVLWFLPAVIGARPRPSDRVTWAGGVAATLRDADYKALVGMVSALQSGRRSTGYLVTRRKHDDPVNSKDTSYVDVHCSFCSRDESPLVDFFLSVGFMADPGAQSAEITELEIAFYHAGNYYDGTWTPDDWRAFVSRTSGLASLEDITFQFDDKERMRAFVREFDTALREVDNLAWFSYAERSAGCNLHQVKVKREHVFD